MSKGPEHHNKGKVECIEAIKEAMTKEAFLGFCKGSALECLWRYEHKGGLADIKKARAYLNYMVEALEEEPHKHMDIAGLTDRDLAIVYVTKKEATE